MSSEVDLKSLVKWELNRSSLWQKEFGHVGSQEKIWKILLELYVCAEEETGLTVKSLWLSSGLPETTALRTFKIMEKQGHLMRIRNPQDSRSFLIVLSMDLRERIERYLIARARIGR